MVLQREALWWQSGIFISPVPSGILMKHSELVCVHVKGAVGHVSVIKCCTAAPLVSWTTWHLPAQAHEKCTVLCLFGVFLWFQRAAHSWRTLLNCFRLFLCTLWLFTFDAFSSSAADKCYLFNSDFYRHKIVSFITVSVQLSLKIFLFIITIYINFL